MGWLLWLWSHQDNMPLAEPMMQDFAARQAIYQTLNTTPQSAFKNLSYGHLITPFYQNTHYQKIWNGERRKALWAAIIEAEQYDALPKGRYFYDDLLLWDNDSPEAEFLYTSAFFQLANDLANGFLNPKVTHRTWNAPVVAESALPIWLSAARDMGVQQQLKAINQDNPRYQALRLLHRELLRDDMQDLLKKKRIDRATVAINLERQRWLPQDLGNEYILVNIPSRRVQVYDNQDILWDDKVIIGKTSTPTPAFIDKMEHVVMSPAWYAPPSLRKGGNGYTPPGPNNPMGRVKFLFPNDHAIYLHDTNQRYLFNNNEVRMHSHGCVRVNNAEGLANVILRNHHDWQDSKKINHAMNKRYETHANIAPVPIYLTYWTLWGDKDYKIYHAQDVYGKDKKLWEQYQAAVKTSKKQSALAWKE